ncbi:MAG: RNA polymerase sigma factor [Streptomyces sp.]|nr:RNA polymerase sigma factor [Streptomyces sp.]
MVSAAQDGDLTALTAVVRQSQPHVRRFAGTLCASPQDAEDAAQEALIILYRRIGTLRATGALASWMFRIVRHECLRQLRALSARGTPAVPDEPPPAASAEEDALHRLEAERIAAAVGALPREQRQVLVLRDLQGLPGPAVARALGLTTPAMKSRLLRARAALRTSLEGEP